MTTKKKTRSKPDYAKPGVAAMARRYLKEAREFRFNMSAASAKRVAKLTVDRNSAEREFDRINSTIRALEAKRDRIRHKVGDLSEAIESIMQSAQPTRNGRLQFLTD